MLDSYEKGEHVRLNRVQVQDVSKHIKCINDPERMTIMSMLTILKTV